MAPRQYTYLVLGGSGRTGTHFISIALQEGHKVKALVRNPQTMEGQHLNLELVTGSMPEYEPLDELLRG